MKSLCDEKEPHADAFDSQTVQNVVVINPGFLSKRRGAGQYARMVLHPPDMSQPEIDGLLLHNVFKRARVEIVRI